jgi:anti-sigma-K factor RskA
MAENNDIEASEEAVASLLRGMTRDDVELVEPPADLWSRIEEEVGPSTEHAVISLESKRRQRGGWIITSAAAAIVVAVIGVFALSSANDVNDVIATAELEYDAENFDSLGSRASGSAALVESDGSFTIDLDRADLPSPDEDADLEVWLIRPDSEGNVADLVSLGVIDPQNPGRLTVPATHDPETYFIVDISIEPRDGVETHSGRSILRGPLAEV